MFVGIAHVIQPEKWMRRRAIPSHIRLESFDNLYLTTIGMPNAARKRPPSVLGTRRDWFFIQDGELGGVGGCYPIPASQRLGNLVKSRSEIVSKFPDENPQSVGRRPLDPQANSVHGGFRVWVDIQGIWFATVVSPEVLIKRAEVFVRPLDLESWPVEWMHGQDSIASLPASQSETGNNAE